MLRRGLSHVVRGLSLCCEGGLSLCCEGVVTLLEGWGCHMLWVGGLSHVVREGCQMS